MVRGDKSSLVVVKEGEITALPSEMKYEFCSVPTLGLTDSYYFLQFQGNVLKQHFEYFQKL